MVRPPSRPGVARVCVEVDLLKKKPNRVWLGMGKTKEDGRKSSMRKTPRNDIARLVPNKVIKSKTSNFVRKSQVQLMQPTKRSPTSSRQLLTLMPIGKNLHKVKEEKLPHVKSTGQRARPSNHLLRIHIIFQTRLRTIRRSRIFFF